jgi:hypothetical protein
LTGQPETAETKANAAKQPETALFPKRKIPW